MIVGPDVAAVKETHIMSGRKIELRSFADDIFNAFKVARIVIFLIKSYM